MARAAEQERLPCLMQSVGKIFNGVDTGGVERGHVAQTQDHYILKLIEVAGSVVELIRGFEEKRAVDAVNGDVRWNFFILESVGAAGLEVFVGDRGHRGGFCNTANVE